MTIIKEYAEELDRKLKEYHDKHQAIPKQPLYHYTSFLGISGILRSKQLWLTHHKFLNDPSEIEHGKHIILKHIENHIKNNKRLSDFIKLLFNDIMVRGYSTFITSFCREGDYLPAWRYYGNDGAGFSIGFKKEYFYQKNETDKRTASLIFEVEYEESSSHRVKEIFTIADNVMNKWASKDKASLEPFLVALLGSLITIVPSIKHPDYSTEHEWRICLSRIYLEKEKIWYPYDFPSEYLFTDNIDTKKNPPFLKKIKTEIPRLTSNKFNYCDIDTIYVGPRLNFKTAKNAIEELLRDCGITDTDLKGIFIKESSRPYQ